MKVKVAKAITTVLSLSGGSSEGENLATTLPFK